jgi:endoglucanase
VRMKKLLLTVLAGSVAWGVLAARAADAFEQNRRLGRGVNVLGYDPLWRSKDQARFQEKHFKLLREAGFDSLRVNLHPFRHFQSDGSLSKHWFETLDWILAGARGAGLNVILDLHEYNAIGNDPEGNKEKFLSFWRQLSTHCQSAPDSVYFELLNEPCRKLTPELWNQWLREALAIVREKNPARTVIIGPAYWNSIDRLGELQLPAEDRNLIVTVHYYKPMEFTHQGARWTPDFADKTGVVWPRNEADRQAIERDFDRAAAWAKSQNRPIFLGEFGAYDKGEMASRARYTSAVARAAEARGWSWAYWQFDSDFVVYDIRQEAWVEPILKALIPAPGGR